MSHFHELSRNPLPMELRRVRTTRASWSLSWETPRSRGSHLSDHVRSWHSHSHLSMAGSWGKTLTFYKVNVIYYMHISVNLFIYTQILYDINQNQGTIQIQ